MVRIEDFKQLDLKVATILKVEDHPNADKLYVLTIGLGAEEKTIVAGIKPYYKPEELVNKAIIVINNLEPANVRGVISHGMLLAAKDDLSLAVLTPDKEIKAGSPIS